MPYQRNPHFTGREQLLFQMRTSLCEAKPKKYNHRLATYGMGGVGKTQTAIEYVYHYRGYYNAIFWISGANQQSLFSRFLEIGVATSCLANFTGKNAQEDEVQVAVKIVLDWLRNHDNWLLVIDNVDIVSVVDGYLPETSSQRHT